MDFFTKNGWVDKYRFITLFSASKTSYREMGLCNVAFCYSQIADGEKAKEYYKMVLSEYPDSELAKVGLRMITVLEKPSDN